MRDVNISIAGTGSWGGHDPGKIITLKIVIQVLGCITS